MTPIRRLLGAALAALVVAPLLALVAPAPAEALTCGAPLRRAHAHNDYEHDRPLLDALDHGFTSVEADVYLVGQELYVAHDPQEVQIDPAFTLRALYLDPLARRVAANGGAVHRGLAGFQLLVDVKTEGVSTYTVLDQQLRGYAAMLTSASGSTLAGSTATVTQRAVTVVVSGNRAREVMQQQASRVAFYDGRLTDQTAATSAPASLIPLISDSFSNNFGASLDDAERQRIRTIVGTAHANGQRVRFYATPDAAGTPAQRAQREAVWRDLITLDVDYLNTDDLPGLCAFLYQHDPSVRRAPGRTRR